MTETKIAEYPTEAQWEEFNANQIRRLDPEDRASKEEFVSMYHLLNEVRVCFGYKPTNEGKIFKNILRLPKTSKPLSKKREPK